MLLNSEQQWGSVARWLHWLMAAAILAMFFLGWTAESWPLSPTKIKLFFWHKSLGITLLVLAIARLAWRAVNPVPALPVAMTTRQRSLARASHGSLYAIMIAMPLSGWVINSAANFPFKVWGVFRLPDIASHSKSVQTVGETVHLALFWVLAVVLVLHIAAAVKHHFFDKDDVLRRMWTGRRLVTQPPIPDGRE